MNPFQGEDFKRLRAHWYQKLREAGFEDIEASEEDRLKEWNPFRPGRTAPARLDPINMEAAREYYTMAVHFLEHYTFPADAHERIWRFHAHGFSLRKIGEFVGRDKDYVHSVVRELRAIMMGKP